MGEAREGDCRVQLIFGLFFICVIGGGVLLCTLTFRKQTEISDWYYVAGITLEAIPWAFWFLTYLYLCFKHRRQQPPSPPPPEAAAAATAPLTSSLKSDEQLNNVNFGLAVVVEDEDEGQGMDEDQRSGHGSDRTSSSSMLNDVEFGIREISEMPLKSASIAKKKLKSASSSCGLTNI